MSKTLTNAQSNAVDALLTITPVTSKLTADFREAGFQLYLVGGSVRDALLGRLGKDLDFTTDARPDDIERLLKKSTKATWDMGRDFGTIGGSVRDGSTDWLVEITTFRADAYEPGSRKPLVEFGDNLDGDLVRRDFAINAMAIDMHTHAFVDPFGGLGDIAQLAIRTPGPAEVSFSDDPLRMMRAARFASQLGFAPVAEVEEAMTRMASRLEIISAERIRDEFTKIVMSADPRTGLDLLVRTGLMEFVMPELSALRLTTDEHMQHKDIYQHTLQVLEQSMDLEKYRGREPDLVGRLAALMHDVGKPRTRKLEGPGKVSFHHHDVVGAKMAKKRLQALHFPADVIKSVAKLTELHLRFHGYGEAGWSDSAVRRYVRDAGSELERLHVLTRADCTTRNRRKALILESAYDDLERRIGELAEQEELDSLRPDLNGDQIMEILEIGPGRDVGAAYNWLLERRIEEGPLGDERAREELLAWWASRKG